ncbi:hypothetical protein ET495_14160 [Xylanimonas allomyrinae]|uniref:Uncharacterized protein n=1 Tax=Xylanimonas allomyrinae TaxID=2509459 RepID=A0A4P6EQP3_9MICO|nr:hypothetical protein [Xylanimonas allomyrinae]QAY64173.1 hypothetical protein ET495_14160 [Xylanimonas allomyrinae]
MSVKTEAWTYFDRIVSDAAPGGVHSNPWTIDPEGLLAYRPDFTALQRLLGVPLYLKAATTTGVPALALDVWLSYELRRAGFSKDAVWPRAAHPRILPQAVANLLDGAPKKLQVEIAKLLTTKASITGVTSSSASILGKNYLKQVDVIMTDWQTGPELLISTKRMDSSFGKNAANRVEESYGDAKNLRLRHPLAALGFVFGLRSTILDEEPDKAEWLIDLLEKLGREDDAYHATCLVMIEYGGNVGTPADDDVIDAENLLVSAGLESEPEDEEIPSEPGSDIDSVLANLPSVKILHDKIPAALSPSRFLGTMVRRVIDATPVTMHREARARIREVVDGVR